VSALTSAAVLFALAVPSCTSFTVFFGLTLRASATVLLPLAGLQFASAMVLFALILHWLLADTVLIAPAVQQETSDTMFFPSCDSHSAAVALCQGGMASKGPAGTGGTCALTRGSERFHKDPSAPHLPTHRHNDLHYLAQLCLLSRLGV
jgi:hypothetical protein